SWSGQPESNRSSPGWKPDALPIELCPRGAVDGSCTHCLVLTEHAPRSRGPDGERWSDRESNPDLRFATPASSQLDDRPNGNIGRPARNRTPSSGFGAQLVTMTSDL